MFLGLCICGLLALLSLDLLYYFFDCGPDYSDDRSFIGFFLEQGQKKFLDGLTNGFVSDFEGHFQYFVEYFFVVFA